MSIFGKFPALDGKSIPGSVMEYIRLIVVRAVEEKGYSPESLIDIFGFSRSTIYSWLKNYQEEGLPGLETHSPPGAEKIITEIMDDWLRETVLHSTPEEHGYDTLLWTRDILAELLQGKFGIKVTGRTVSLHLKTLNLSYQKPEYQAAEQDPDKVACFLEVKFPMIQRLADRIGADIAFEDEAGIGVQTRSGLTWGEKGKTPVVIRTDARGGFNILSTVSAEGILRYSVIEGSLNSDRYIIFLKHLLRGRKKPLILIADNASFHKSRKIREFHRLHRQKFKIFFLPAYSPKLNPDEQVWGEIKNHKIGRQPVKNKPDLKRRVFSALASLQKTTQRIISFFALPDTNYAGNV
jgi:transposase